MERLISSPRTRYYKRTFPRLYFGFLGFFFAVSCILVFTASDSRVLLFVLGPLLLGPFGYFIMRRFIFDMVDEVYDEGDALVVKNDGREERIPLANITNVADTVATNPARITLTLREPTPFGREVTFSPPRQALFPVGGRHPLALELIDRIDAARHSHAKA